ncbi:hemerythrin [Spirochaetia bacterium]|nr:hemerythrin [Spirochaetia bacterium]
MSEKCLERPVSRPVSWDERYSVGIQHIDSQHKNLIAMSENLYTGCLKRGEGAKDFFLNTIYNAAEYIQFHFAEEEQLLEKINYPDFLCHKEQHESFVRQIFGEIKNFESGNPLAPVVFVRYVRDWLFTHITFIDKKYATYLHILKQAKSGGLPPPEMFWG